MNPALQECLALLVDFDGVLRVWPGNDHGIESSCSLPLGSIRQAAFEPRLLAQALTGQITDESWRQEIAGLLSTRFPNAQAATAVEQWSLSVGKIDPEVLQLLAVAREHVRLVLVTNATSRLSQDLDVLGLGNFFHAVVNSSEIGVVKPNPAIFNTAMSLSGSNFEQSLYVDDSPKNIAAAEKHGLRSLLFQGHLSMRRFLHSNSLVTTAKQTHPG